MLVQRKSERNFWTFLVLKQRVQHLYFSPPPTYPKFSSIIILKRKYVFKHLCLTFFKNNSEKKGYIHVEKLNKTFKNDLTLYRNNT